MLRALPPLACVIWLWAGAAAQAGTVTVEPVIAYPFRMPMQVASTVHFVDAAGEANRLTVDTFADHVVVHDDGAPIVIGAGQAGPGGASQSCTRTDAQTVSCPAGVTDAPDDVGTDDTIARVEAGDGDDVVTATGAGRVTLEGGAGDDRLVAQGGPALLLGGSGRDVIQGGPGDDRIGVTSGLASGGDIDGGGGTNEVFSVDAAPLVADLGAGSIGSGRLAHVQDLTGGAGADVLTGDDGPNVLAGGTGPDRLAGGGGDDTLDLSTSTTPDDLEAVPVLHPDVDADRADCGGGRDVVVSPGPTDALAACERVGGDGDIATVAVKPLIATRQVVRVRVDAVRPDEVGEKVTATLTARIAGRAVALASARVRRPGTLTIRIGRTGQRRLTSSGVRRAELTVKSDEYSLAADGFTQSVSVPVRLG